MHPKVSILIPVYNGRPYLEDLAECLQRQTLSDFEAIFIDDQSTDGSLALLKRYAAADSRFKIIEMPYKGGNAVKGIRYGLPHCSGKYFFYMSQDDLIESDTLEKLTALADASGADAVVPDMEWFFEQGTGNRKITPPEPYGYLKTISGETAFRLALPWKIHGFYLRKTDLLKQVGYDDSYLTGDEINARKYLYFCKKVTFCPTTFYYRQDNPDALTKQFRPQTIEDIYGYIDLLVFMQTQQMDRVLIRQWHHYALHLFLHYRNMAASHSDSLSAADKKLTQKKLYTARNRLLAFSLRHAFYTGGLKLIRKSKICWHQQT
ncbi:MAG: glycosyltransferase family 2 protein [Eikenella sp.]|nr:glycosyltransferase family 2 protein [Eikenella sp.]